MDGGFKTIFTVFALNVCGFFSLGFLGNRAFPKRLKNLLVSKVFENISFLSFSSDLQ